MESRESLLGSLPVFQSLSRIRGVNNDAPLPQWGPADVEEFGKADPVYGPQVSGTAWHGSVAAWATHLLVAISWGAGQ